MDVIQKQTPLTMRATATFFGATLALFLLALPSATPLMAQAASGCYWLSFDGTDDYVSVGHSTTLNPGTSSFTVAGWFKASAAATNRILISKRAMGDGVGNAGFALLLNGSGNLRALVDNGTSLFDAVSPGPYQDNTWRHVAVTFVRSGGNLTITIYVNGVSVVSSGPTAVAGSLNNTRSLTLGAGLNGANAIQQPLNGDLDDFAYWGRALTVTEIEDLAANTTSPAALTTQLRAYWPFEEGMGTSTTDAGPNSNEGMLQGGTTWPPNLVLFLPLNLSPPAPPLFARAAAPRYLLASLMAVPTSGWPCPVSWASRIPLPTPIPSIRRADRYQRTGWFARHGSHIGKGDGFRRLPGHIQYH
jgi:hypothetical protein